MYPEQHGEQGMGCPCCTVRWDPHNATHGTSTLPQGSLGTLGSWFGMNYLLSIPDAELAASDWVGLWCFARVAVACLVFDGVVQVASLTHTAGQNSTTSMGSSAMTKSFHTLYWVCGWEDKFIQGLVGIGEREEAAIHFLKMHSGMGVSLLEAFHRCCVFSPTNNPTLLVK